MTPMLDSELNELVHQIADYLEKYTDGPVDRTELNTKVTVLVQDCGIQFEDDYQAKED